MNQWLDEKEQENAVPTKAKNPVNHFPPATLALIAVLSAVFAIEVRQGAVRETTRLLDLGAISPQFIAMGEWQRLFLGPWLHIDFNHFLGNVVALAAFGAISENLLGWRRFLFVYLVSGIVAALTSHFTVSAMIAVGASGAIYGLLGATLSLQLSRRERLVKPWGWAYILIVSIALPLVMPQIDWAAHLGGFCAGFAATRWVSRHDHLEPEMNPLPLQEMLGSIVILYCFAFGSFTSSSEEHQANLLAMLEDTTLDPNYMNGLAWNAVVNTSSSSRILTAASQAMLPLIESIDGGTSSWDENKQAAFIDTYAGLLFRQGALASAINYERQALLRENKADFRQRFAIFLDRYYENNGVLANGGAAKDDVRLEIVQEDAGALRLDLLRNSMGKPLVVVVMAYSSKGIGGYLICQFLNESSLSPFRGVMEFGEQARELNYKVVMIDGLNYRPGDDDFCRATGVGIRF